MDFATQPTSQPSEAEDLLHGLTPQQGLKALLEGFTAAAPPSGLYSYGSHRRALPRAIVLKAVGYLMCRLGHARPDELIRVLPTPENSTGWSALLVSDSEKVVIGYDHLTTVLLFEACVTPSGRPQAQFVGRQQRA